MKSRVKVFVGMSGGVDSSVSAALLQRSGYDVTGVFIKTWSPDWLPCTWKEERRDAMRAAAALKIPLITLDLEEEYKKGVADYMISEYRAGRVPNPDVMCNKVIKFGGFFDFAMKNGADFVATGHYAQIKDSKLLKSLDEEKDQTYFLWTLGQRELSRTLFPIGHLRKSEVRKLAKKFNLPNAEKKDSQGLCFIGKINVKEFLKHYIKEKRGDVLNEAGEIIGEHDGAVFFTIGERHGFRIFKKGTHDKPYYVIGKDIEKNELTVSMRPSTENRKLDKDILISNINWNQGQVPLPSQKLKAQIRYHGELYDCKIKNVSEGEYKVFFKNPPIAPSPGQSIVFYSKGICLGGGVIV